MCPSIIPRKNFFSTIPDIIAAGLAAAAAFAVAVCGAGCSRIPGNALVTRSALLMDTLVEIKVPAGTDEKATDAAFAEIARIEKKYSPVKGDFARAAAGKETLPIDDETYFLLDFALKISRMSHGALDPASGELYLLWKNPPGGKPPSRKAIESAKISGGAEKIALERGLLRKPRGTIVDFGAFVKGYAADRAAEILKKSGVREGLVNAGGDIRVFGPRVWRVAVRHPAKESGFLGVIPVKNKAVATSGGYERFFETGGVRYHHIIDPASGEPARGVLSATVVADDCLTADALSTAVFVLGAQKGSELVRATRGAQVVIVGEGGAMRVSGELKKTKFVY